MSTEPPPSDADLIAAINRGDWAAFDTLYFRHRDWAYRLAWRFCRDADDAQNTVQEVFLYLAGKFPGLELRANFTTLLYPAVKHTALAIRRKRQRTPTTAVDLETQLTAPPDPPDAASQRRQLAESLAGLPETHREVLLMRFVDDLTLEEIATVLAIPLGTAKSRLHHALRHLRDDPRSPEILRLRNRTEIISRFGDLPPPTLAASRTVRT